MNDNDIIKIIKALECQLGIDDSCNCYGCLFREDKSCINASERILEVVKDLINHQKAEIADLEAKNKICAEVIARQDKEIENLSKSVDNYESCLRSVEVIRADAIKEFAERLNIHVIPQKRDGYTCDIVLKSSIDNLVKEMTEAQNAPHNNGYD